MIRTILNFFIERKLLVNLLIVVTVLFGMSSLKSLKRESMPSIDMYQVFYSTIYPGASAEDVELKVTIPLEDALKGVDDIKEMTSTSYENISTIKLVLEDYLSAEDAKTVKQDLQKAVDRVVDLPSEVVNRPTFFEVKTDMMPIIEVALRHDDESILRHHAMLLEKKIEKLPEVSSVAKIGYLDREVKIALDPKKLIRTETPIVEVMQALQGRNIRLSGGKIETTLTEKSIITDEELRSVDDIGRTIIRATYGGNRLRVRDVGTVVDGLEDPSLLVRSNGKPGISLKVTKKKNADAIRTIRSIKELLAEEQQKLDEGLEVGYVNDRSVMTKNRIKIVTSNALIGLLLVLISLKFFLDFKTAAWTAFGIPFSLVVSFIVLKMVGMSINPLSLGAFVIVIGMLVDDAIVVAENIKRHKEMGKAPMDAVKDGVNEVAVPVITTIATSVLAFSPLMYVPGLMGKFMRVFPIVIIVTLLASLTESLLFLPAHLLHKREKLDKKKAWVVKLEQRYQELLFKVINFRYAVLVLALLVFVGSVIFAKNTLKFELMPSGDVDAVYIKMEAPLDTSLQRMSMLVRDIEGVVENLKDDDISSYGATIGNDGTGDNQGRNHGHVAAVSIYLAPANIRLRTSKEIISQIEKKLKPYRQEFSKISIEKQSFGPPVGKPVHIRLVSDNDEKRIGAGNELFAYVSSLTGILDPRTDDGQVRSVLRLDINKNKLAELGLSVRDVATTVRTAYEGAIVFSLRKDNEDVDHRIILADKFRGNINYLLELPVRNKMGKLVRLKKFATLQDDTNVLEINRYDGQRVFSIYSELDSDRLTSMEAKQKILAFYAEELKDSYPEVEIIATGESEESKASMKALMQSFLIAILGVYFLLVLLFNSFSQPMFVLSAIPFAFVGIIWAFYFHGHNFSFAAMMGFVGLSGVVVNDSLIMVDYINKKSTDIVGKSDFIASVVKGAGTRLRPILLTSITTVLGVIPTVYGWGGTDFILIPMTMALGYGLAFSTIITLFLVPVLTVTHRDFVKKKTD